MLYADFCWDCPKCKKMNWEDAADEDKVYKCRGCAVKFILTFTVEVEEIQRYDEKSDTVKEVKLIEVGISRDNGLTWERVTVDSRDLNPETSPIKPGDWLEHNGEIWAVTLNEKLNRLQTSRLEKQKANA